MSSEQPYVPCDGQLSVRSIHQFHFDVYDRGSRRSICFLAILHRLEAFRDTTQVITGSASTFSLATLCQFCSVGISAAKRSSSRTGSQAGSGLLTTTVSVASVSDDSVGESTGVVGDTLCRQPWLKPWCSSWKHIQWGPSPGKEYSDQRDTCLGQCVDRSIDADRSGWPQCN